ncbi:MAG: hypothetical protein Q9165_006811 [Trypethelium subeluteriae]
MKKNGSGTQRGASSSQIGVKSPVVERLSRINFLKGTKRNAARLPRTQPKSIWNRRGSQLNVESITSKRARIEENTKSVGDSAPNRDAFIGRYPSISSAYSRTDSHVPDYIVSPHQRTDSHLPDYKTSPHYRTDSYIPEYSNHSRKRQRSFEDSNVSPSRKSQHTNVPREWHNAEFTFRPTGSARHVQDRFPEARGWLHCPSLKRSKCQPGTIVLSQWVKPLLDNTIPVGDKSRVDTEHGALVVKIRPFVVFSFNYDNIVVLPMYTYKGRGISGMPREKQQEHVAMLSDEEYRTQLSDPFTERYGANDPLAVDSTTAASGWTISTGSSVRFTERETIDFKTPIFPVGRLRPDCTKKLMQMTAQHSYQCYATHGQRK